MRVLRPGGALLVDFGGGTPAPWHDPCEQLLQRHGVHHLRPGVSRADEVAEYLAERTTLRRLPPVFMTVQRTLRQDLDEWESQIHAWTWPYSADQMRAACDDIREWASKQGQSLDAVAELERTIQWWAFG